MDKTALGKNDNIQVLVINGERVGDLVAARDGLRFFTTRPELKGLNGTVFSSREESTKIVGQRLRQSKISA